MVSSFGGLGGLESKLETNFSSGLAPDTIEKNRSKYGVNSSPSKEIDSWLQMFINSFDDPTLILLIISAGTTSSATSVVLLVAIITATQEHDKETKFQELNKVSESINVSVLRNSNITVINTEQVVVGDIVQLDAGDLVPADGVYVSGSDVATDESSLTGEPDEVSKGHQGDGTCRMLVLAVGVNSEWGRIKTGLETETVNTPLQDKLEILAENIGYMGMAFAAATFIAMMASWYMLAEETRSQGLFETVLEAFIMAVTIVVVAIPEGLPLAVAISLAYSTKKMMADNNLIRILAACETMGNATTICSDKTGTLTQNRMTVVAGWMADEYYEGTNAKGICCNSTASLGTTDTAVIGNKTEGALLLFAAKNFQCDYTTVRNENFLATRGDRLYTFTSARKSMSVLIMGDSNSTSSAPKTSKGSTSRGNSNGGVVSYTKGASEVIISKCTHYTNADVLSDTVDRMAKQALRTAAEADDVNTVESGMCLDAVFGIKDPLRPDVTDAVRTCQNAASAIARECGILTEGGVVLDGPTFRSMSPSDLDQVLPKLQVLARSSPMDKHTLVTPVLPGYYDEWIAARETGGDVVGVTGDGTNDGPALKAADVGLSMGLSGTDVAKAASSIVILDDNFASIVKAVKWGRSVFDNIRKFLQFQLTVNVVALTVTFVSAYLGQDPPLNARLPYRRDASLISLHMIRNIAIQSIYQIALLSSSEHTSLIFTTFVICQLFNEINARSIDDKMNVFSGIFDNGLFIGVIAVTSCVQWVLVENPKVNWLIGAVSLPEGGWYKCIVLGSLSLPLGGLMRMIPVPLRTSDTHEPSPLIKNSVDNNKKAPGTMKIEFSFSFAMWILACLLILCHASAEFFPLWIVHLRAHGGSFAMFASAGLNALVKVLKPLAKLIDL
eukprot:GSChrysophyteH1.ASY1.ANO1.1003.1 assembled CDS